MIKKTKKIANYLLLLILLIIIGIFLYGQSQINSCYKYTIAKGVEITGGYKNNFSLKYSFKFKNSLYFTSKSIPYEYNKEDNKYLLEKRILIKLACKSPTISEVLWEKEVPNDIYEAPQEGWDKMPF